MALFQLPRQVGSRQRDAAGDPLIACRRLFSLDCVSHTDGAVFQDLRDIRAALHGKAVDPETGRVDHGSPATTPHLKLYGVVYQEELLSILHSDGGAAEVRAELDGV